MANYVVPESYAGKSLQDLYQPAADKGYIFDPGGVGQWGGVGANQALTTGQVFNAPEDPGSAGVKFLQGMFTPQGQYQQQAAATKEQQMMDLLNQGKTESIDTIKSGKADLDTRYQDIVASITGTANDEKDLANRSIAESFGKRGIETSGASFDRAQQQARAPIETARISSTAGVGWEKAQLDQARDKAIADIQRGTSQDQVNAAMDLYRITELARTNNLTFEEGVRQFNEQLSYDKSQSDKTTDDPYARYTALSEGQSLFDLGSLQNIFKNPKTYKAGGSDEDGY